MYSPEVSGSFSEVNPLLSFLCGGTFEETTSRSNHASSKSPPAAGGAPPHIWTGHLPPPVRRHNAHSGGDRRPISPPNESSRPPMEEMFAGASFLSQLGAKLFRCPPFGWVASAQKLYVRGPPFLMGVVAVIWWFSGGDDDRPRSCRPGERNKVKPGSRGEDDGRGVRLSDVETIMERMGLGGGGCVDGDEPRGAVGADDLERLFEEKEPSLEEVKAAFCVFDHDGDGFIESGELRRVLRLLGFEEATAADCGRMIDAHDDNGDGRIDFNEFVKLMESSFC